MGGAGRNRTQQAISKTAASLAFVLFGVVRWSVGDAVGGWLLAGITLCALGDVPLLQDRIFDLGLLAVTIGV